MKLIITESQYQSLISEKRYKDEFVVYDLGFFSNNHWEAFPILTKILNHRGNPRLSIIGDVDLRNKRTDDWEGREAFNSLVSVSGDLDLGKTSLDSLNKLK